MNDKKLKDQFPHAWELFLFFSGLRTVWYPFDDPLWYRQLFEFFDIQDIAVEIGVDLTLEAKYCYRVFYLKDDEWINSGVGIWSDLFYTRREAEEEAFERAFEIFEKQLTQ